MVSDPFWTLCKRAPQTHGPTYAYAVPAVSGHIGSLKLNSRLTDSLAQLFLKANTTYAVGVAMDLVWRDAASFGADGSGNGETMFRDNGDGTSTKVLAAHQNCVRSVKWVGTGLQKDYKDDKPDELGDNRRWNKLGDNKCKTVNIMNNCHEIQCVLRHLKIGEGLPQEQQEEEQQEEDEDRHGHRNQTRKRKSGEKSAAEAGEVATHQVAGVGEYAGEWFDACVDRLVPAGTKFSYTAPEWYGATEVVSPDELESRVRKIGGEGSSAVEVTRAAESEKGEGSRAKRRRRAASSPCSSSSSSSSSSS